MAVRWRRIPSENLIPNWLCCLYKAFGLWQLQPTKKIIVCGVALTELTEEEDDDDTQYYKVKQVHFGSLKQPKKKDFDP